MLRKLKSRSGPLLLGFALVTLGVFACLSAASRYAGSYRAQIVDAKRFVLAASTRTRLGLVTSMRSALNDPALSRNLDWRLKTSIEGLLNSVVSASVLDQLTLFDQNCQRVAQGSSRRMISLPCPSAGEIGHFQRTTDGRVALLTLAIPVGSASKPAGVLLGSVMLDESWLNSHVGLPKLFKSFALELPSGDKPDADQVAQATSTTHLITFLPNFLGETTLVSTSRIQRFLQGAAYFDHPLRSMADNLVLPLLAILIALSLAERIRIGTSLRRRTVFFANWYGQSFSRDSSSQKISERLLKCAKAPAPRAFFALLIKGLEQYLTDMKAEKTRLTSELAQAQSQIESQTATIKTLEAERDRLQGSEAALRQMQGTCDQILAKWTMMRDGLAGATGKIEGDLAAARHSLSRWVTNWQQGIDSRGSRKFIRSLAESPSNSSPTATALDDEMEFLFDSIRRVNEELAGLGRDVQQSESDGRLIHMLLSDWLIMTKLYDEGASIKTSSTTPQRAWQAAIDLWKSALPNCTASSLKWVNTSRGGEDQLSSGSSQSACSLVRVQIPTTFLSSALFHVGRCLAHSCRATSPGASIMIDGHIKSNGSDVQILLSASLQNRPMIVSVGASKTLADSGRAAQRGPVDQLDMEIAEKIIEASGGKLHLLPGLNQGMSAAISIPTASMPSKSTVTIDTYRRLDAPTSRQDSHEPPALLT